MRIKGTTVSTITTWLSMILHDTISAETRFKILNMPRTAGFASKIVLHMVYKTRQVYTRLPKNIKASESKRDAKSEGQLGEGFAPYVY